MKGRHMVKSKKSTKSLHPTTQHQVLRLAGLTLVGVWLATLLCSAPILPNTRYYSWQD